MPRHCGREHSQVINHYSSQTSLISNHMTILDHQLSLASMLWLGPSHFKRLSRFSLLESLCSHFSLGFVYLALSAETFTEKQEIISTLSGFTVLIFSLDQCQNNSFYESVREILLQNILASSFPSFLWELSYSEAWVSGYWAGKEFSQHNWHIL